jgi:alkanesulfonate monooxygenase SsuD/methylene tetrahydromethanopterin reductase-like flavin-dependent oxidoreductase (luciferase family)
MSPLKLGAALAIVEQGPSGQAPSWERIKASALAAEHAGFETVWIADELLWEQSDPAVVSGWWECVALLGAISAVTSEVEVGSWVLSALHRNPGLTAKAVETLDEISDGRFIFGFGSGHAGRQGEAFGYPPDRTVGRYVEALDIIVGLIRSGSSTHTGQYHTTVNLEHRPRGPQWPHIPLMLGGHGPRTISIAVEHADIWSAYATTSSAADAFSALIRSVDDACAAAGRDPATLQRSVGIGMWPNDIGADQPEPVIPLFIGSTHECLAELKKFCDLGFDRVELLVPADQPEVIEAFRPLVEAAKGF